MFNKIKNFFGNKGKDQAQRSKGKPAQPSSSKSGSIAQSHSESKLLTALDLTNAVEKEVLPHIKNLRMALARTRLDLANGDSTQLKQMRLLRQRLALAQSRYKTVYNRRVSTDS